MELNVKDIQILRGLQGMFGRFVAKGGQKGLERVGVAQC